MNHVPQIVLLCLLSFNLLYSAYMHGKDRGKYNFWVNFISMAIDLSLLNWGGFFN